jgi:hypothetical protein
VLVALFMGTFAMAIAIQTPRRAFGTGAIVAAFVILSAIASIFVATVEGDGGRYAILLSPVDTLEGMTYWIFGAEPPLESVMDDANLNGFVYLATILAVTVIATGVVLRRILRMNV